MPRKLIDSVTYQRHWNGQGKEVHFFPFPVNNKVSRMAVFQGLTLIIQNIYTKYAHARGGGQTLKINLADPVRVQNALVQGFCNPNSGESAYNYSVQSSPSAAYAVPVGCKFHGYKRTHI